MSSSGTTDARIVLVGDRRVDRLQHELALARVRGHADPPVAAAVLDVRERRQRTAAAVAEQHDRLGAAAAHPLDRGGDVARREVVQAVGVVVQVARREAEHRVAGGREQRARVVHGEVGTGMRQHHRGVPRRAARRRPEQPAHERAVVGDDADRLAGDVDAGIVFGERPEAEAGGARLSSERIAHDRIGWPTVPRLTSRSRSVRDQVVLVTGAASGMGRAIAHLFADEGARVAVTDRDAQGVDTVAGEIVGAGGLATGWTLDVADAAAIVQVVAEVARQLGPVDILVNDAGVSIPVEISADDFEEA